MLDNLRVRLSSLGPLVLRVGVGLGLAGHGWARLVALHKGERLLEEVLGAGTGAVVLVWALAIAEFFGGLCLLLGLLTRLWSAAAVTAMTVALAVPHRADVVRFFVHLGQAAAKLFTQPSQFSQAMRQAVLGGAELAWLYGIGALALLVMGPGAFSLDHLIGLIFRGRRANAVVGLSMRYPALERRSASTELTPLNL